MVGIGHGPLADRCRGKCEQGRRECDCFADLENGDPHCDDVRSLILLGLTVAGAIVVAILVVLI